MALNHRIVFPSDENHETSNMETETEEEYQLQPVTQIINTENVVSVVNQVFQLKPMETNRYTPKNKKLSGTEHRVLTSPEVLELKRKEREARDERERKKSTKKIKAQKSQGNKENSTTVQNKKRSTRKIKTKFIDDFCYYDE